MDALAAALWLARRQSDYLLGVEGPDFQKWRSGQAAAEVDRTVALGAALVRHWVEQTRAQLGDIDRARVGAWLERANALVLGPFLRPFDVDFDAERQLFADMEAAHFIEGAGSRLMRGLANCDMHSHLLTLVLRGWTRAEPICVSGHRLVRLPAFVEDRGALAKRLGFGAPVLLDGYSDLPPFVLEPVPAGIATLASLEPIVAERDRQYRARGRSPGEPLRSAAVYAKARAITLPPERPRPVPSLDPSPTSPNRDLVGIYFEARAHHLFGSPAQAGSLYRSIASTEGEQPGWLGSVRWAALQFAERLGW